MDLGLPWKWFYDSMICFDILYCKDHWESLITDISEGKQNGRKAGLNSASQRRFRKTMCSNRGSCAVSVGSIWMWTAMTSTRGTFQALKTYCDMFIIWYVYYVCLLLMSICWWIQYKCLLYVYCSICQLLIINMVNLFQIIIFLVPFFLLILVYIFCFGFWASLSLQFDMKLCRTTDVGFLSSVTVAPAGGVLLPLVLT